MEMEGVKAEREREIKPVGSERLHGSPTRNSTWRPSSVRVACAHRARNPLGFSGNKGRKIEKGREA